MKMGGIYSYIFGEEQPPSEATDEQQTQAGSSPSENSSGHSVKGTNLQSCMQNELSRGNAQTNCTKLISQTPDHIHEVDRKNIHVKCAGKSREFYIFPDEKISVLHQEACAQARKDPNKMKLVFKGQHLEESKRLRDYPTLRGGSIVHLIHV